MKFIITLFIHNILICNISTVHIYISTKLTRPPKGVGGGEGGGSHFADKCTVQYSRSLFSGQQRLCLAPLKYPQSTI